MFDEADGLVADCWQDSFVQAFWHSLCLPHTVLLFSLATIPRKFEDEWLNELHLGSATLCGYQDQYTAEWAVAGDMTPQLPVSIVRNWVTSHLNI